MKKITYYIVDVFTSEKFGGNQLAVVPDASEIPENLLQKIAREFNFSETTFVYPQERSTSDFKLRIFCPDVEVPMAGHPTIGTSFIVLNEQIVQPKNTNHIIIEEKVGDIKVNFVKEDNKFHSISMNQPLPKFGPIVSNKELVAEILSLKIEDIHPEYPIQTVSCGNNFLYVPVVSLEVIKNIKVRTDLLEKNKLEIGSTEIYAFTHETEFDNSNFHTRMFAPLFGVHEDPATGSGVGPFGCYLVKNGIHNGKNIICEQGFEINRPSILHVNIETGNNEITGVNVSGDVVMFGKGEFYIW